jgi:hypothetical protein
MHHVYKSIDHSWGLACDSHLPVVQAGNLRIFVFLELRRIIAGAAVGVVVARRDFVHLFATETAGHSRTEDYQQTRYQNHPTTALLASKSRPLV